MSSDEDGSDCFSFGDCDGDDSATGSLYDVADDDDGEVVCEMCGALHTGRWDQRVWCFSSAIHLNDVGALRRIVAFDRECRSPEIDINRAGESETSTVAICMQNRHYEMARVLLAEYGADPDAFFGAAEDRVVGLDFADTAAAATMLFDAGATCTARQLGRLCRNGWLEAARVVAARSAPYLDARHCTTDRRRRTTLLHDTVAFDGNEHVVRWLVEEVGVDAWALDAHGRTARDLVEATAERRANEEWFETGLIGRSRYDLAVRRYLAPS